MLLTDLHELKAVLDVAPDNTAEDKKLNFFIEYASKLIEQLLNRSFEYRRRVEYYAGTGTQKICLRHRPVYTTPVVQVFYDSFGYYDASGTAFDDQGDELTYGDSFALVLDWDSDGDGIADASRSGILVRMNNVWSRPSARQQGYLSPFVTESLGNYKVVSTGGYTIDTLPAEIRAAANILCAKLRLLMPLGMWLNSESYEERHVSYYIPHKRQLMSDVWPLIQGYRNQNFGGSVGN